MGRLIGGIGATGSACAVGGAGRAAPARALVCVCFLAASVVPWPGTAKALETDQYTPPPQPLADLSPQFRQHTRAVLQRVISRANLRSLDATAAARRTSNKGWKQAYLDRAAYYLTEDYIARALYDEVGHGLPDCTIESWVAKSRFPYEHYRFQPSVGQSVYGANPFGRPLTLQDLSPTVNLFGVYMGTDKVGHVFQQGYEYFREYRKGEARGMSDEEARQKAVEVGIGQEHGFFGLVMVGVYSNADLAANYAGMKLYLNLTRPLVLGGVTRPPVLVRRDGLWQINPEAGDEWLRPFFTEHFNEALNPSRYSGQLRDTVRSHFPERAARWVEFYHTDRAAEADRLKRLTTWCGEDYGHSGLAQVASVLDLHFDRPAVAEAPAHDAKAQPARHRIR
jgi:hypothetical protein